MFDRTWLPWQRVKHVCIAFVCVCRKLLLLLVTSLVDGYNCHRHACWSSTLIRHWYMANDSALIHSNLMCARWWTAAVYIHWDIVICSRLSSRKLAIERTLIISHAVWSKFLSCISFRSAMTPAFVIALIPCIIHQTDAKRVEKEERFLRRKRSPHRLTYKQNLNLIQLQSRFIIFTISLRSGGFFCFFFIY